MLAPKSFITVWILDSKLCRVALVCPLDADSSDQRFVIVHKGLTSRDDVSDELLAAVKQIRSSTSGCTLIDYKDREYLISYFAVVGNLFLIGAGHVAACTAEAAARFGFRVIVTPGHMHDLEVLEQALQTKAGCIGMIGSRKKRNALYADLMDKGIREVQLDQVRCPIGMAIEADTPEEIAVSIVGELIYLRATGRKA